MDSGYMKQIRKRILAAEDGTTFATSDFADIADSATVRQSLNRLVQAGILQRVLRGIFVKPKFCSTLNEFVEVNPDAVAKTLARTYHLHHMETLLYTCLDFIFTLPSIKRAVCD